MAEGRETYSDECKKDTDGAKTVLAGGIHETLMASFNAAMAPSRPSGCCDSAFMIEVAAREPCGVEVVRKGERSFCHETSRANRLMW